MWLRISNVIVPCGVHISCCPHAEDRLFAAACLGAALLANLHHAILRMLPATHAHLAFLHAKGGQFAPAFSCSELALDVHHFALYMTLAVDGSLSALSAGHEKVTGAFVPKELIPNRRREIFNDIAR